MNRRLIATCFVHGEPKGQPRPRAFVRAGRAAVYDAGTAENWKSAIASALRFHQGKLHEGPFEVEMFLYFPRPKSHFGTRGLLARFGSVFFRKKPDVDNVAKAVLDSLSEKNGIGFWKDDADVTDLIVRKRWADGRPAGAQIDISILDEGVANPAGLPSVQSSSALSQADLL